MRETRATVMRAEFNGDCDVCRCPIYKGNTMVFMPGKMKRRPGDWAGKWPRQGAHMHPDCNPGFATRQKAPRREAQVVFDPGDYDDLDMWSEDPDIGDR